MMKSESVGNQIERNRRQRELQDFDPRHRERISQLIRATVNGGREAGSLLVFGAGNCHDLNFADLLNTFGHIHLVDLDAAALEAVVNQQPTFRDRLSTYAPVDVAWPLLQLSVENPSLLSEQTGGSRPSEWMKQLAGVAVPWTIPTAETVVSTCLLTQLIESLSLICPPDSSAFVPALQALRIGHLRRLVNQCRPGGSILLVTDVVASDTAPELNQIPPDAASSFLSRCLAAGNHFVGCHPDRLVNDLKILAAATGRVDCVRIFDPWLWKLGSRAFGVYAVQADMSSSPP